MIMIGNSQNGGLKDTVCRQAPFIGLHPKIHYTLDLMTEV